jgi:hypothetical protein
MDVPATDPAVLRTCSACGTASSGNYCGECGARIGADIAAAPQLTRQEVGGLMIRQEAIDLVGLDRRLGATIRDLLLHPTRVVAAHLGGDANSYVPPLKLFFTLAGLYMLLLSWIQPFSFDPEALRTLGLGSEHAGRLGSLLRERGITIATFNERVQSRMNATVPLGVALGLLPMVWVLRVLDRRGTAHENLIFMLTFSNAIWLMSLLLLPFALWFPKPHELAMYVVTYAYLGVGFFAFYATPSRARTAFRFSAFVLADLIVTFVCGIVLMSAVIGSILLF